MNERTRTAQREQFRIELARLRAKEQAGTLTASERTALERATAVRAQRLAAAAARHVAEARGRALPSRITRAVGGGSPGQGKRA
jgi:hypothetical protein